MTEAEVAWRWRAIGRRRLGEKVWEASLVGREIPGAAAALAQMEPGGDAPAMAELSPEQKAAMASARAQALARKAEAHG